MTGDADEEARYKKFKEDLAAAAGVPLKIIALPVLQMMALLIEGKTGAKETPGFLHRLVDELKHGRDKG